MRHPGRGRGPRTPLALLLLVGLPTGAVADGMYQPLTGEAVANTADQQAILAYGDDWTRLVLRTGYSGNGKPFAWVVPSLGLLTENDVGTADPVIFNALDDVTAPQLVRYDLGCGTHLGCAEEAGSDAGSTSEPAGVIVFRSFVVAEFRIDVVAAQDPAALGDWFTAQGYSLPTNAEPILADYIARGFSFVAVRVEPGASGGGGEQPDAGVGGEGEGEGGAEGEGETTPPQPVRALVMRFPGLMTTFPLRISSLSTREEVEVLLYTIGTTRHQVAPNLFPTVPMLLPPTYDGDDFDSYYRDQLLAQTRTADGRPAFAVEFAGPAPDPLFGLLLEQGILLEGGDAVTRPFVTRLRARLRPEQMDRDIVLQAIPGAAGLAQHRVRVVAGGASQEAGLAALLPVDGLLVLVLAGLAMLRGRGRRRP